MKRTHIQRTEQPNKMESFLKELNIRRPSSPGLRHGAIQAIDKMPSLQIKPDSNSIQRPRFHVENRSVSELSGRLGSLDLGHSRRISNDSPSIDHNSTFKKTTKVKLPKLQTHEAQLIFQDRANNQLRQTPTNAASLTIDMKKKKLVPIKQQKIRSSYKTKAGSNGSQTKINQDAAILQNRLPHARENLTKLLRRRQQKPDQIIPIVEEAFAITNTQLLNSQINTDLSGSTVVAVVIYEQTLYCFNVGDSRAILISQVGSEWKAKQLSIDQKPSRKDQHDRIVKAGGRIQAQTDQQGSPIGPLRVWMANLQLPGLAMTRSFGDKAGVRAGTNAIPEVMTHKITPEDKLLAIASDGVWEYLQNDQVKQLLIPYTNKNSLEEGCQRVVNHAASIWKKVCLSRDDITIILVSLQD